MSRKWKSSKRNWNTKTVTKTTAQLVYQESIVCLNPQLLPKGISYLHKIEIMKICQTVQMKRNWVKRKRLNQIKKPPRLVRVQWRSKPRKWLPWTKHFLETGTNQFSPTTFHISLKSIKIRSKLLKKFNPWKRSKTSSASKDPWKMQN